MKQQQSSNTFVYVVLGLIVIGIIALAIVRTRPKPTPAGAQELAQCLNERGAKFYGASWCTHCKAQKDLFGGAAKLLPYVECAVGQAQIKECADAGIDGYPTWVNAKGDKISGEQSFTALAEFSGCEFKP